MIKPTINTFRIDVNYAFVQGSFCAGMCALNAFTAVYLFYKGLTNTQAGITVSLISFSAIFIQLFVSNFADSHANISLKKIVLVLYLAVIAGCSLLWLLPLPVAFLIMAYSVAAASQRSIMPLLNAMMMQFTNIGLPVNYGWPRGVCSIMFAIVGFFMGILIEHNSPDIIMPIVIGLLAIAITSIILMPNPDKLVNQYELNAAEAEKSSDTGLPADAVKTESPVSYPQMIRRNPTLMLFIGASILLALGNSTAGVFMIRILEAVGGDAQDLGTLILIQAGIEFPMLFASVFVLKKFKINHILIFSFFSFTIKQLGFILAPSVGAIYGVGTINIFCVGIYAFASVMFVHKIVRRSEMVRAQTLVMLAGTIGEIVGSMVSGMIIDTFGLQPLLILGDVALLSASFLMIACHRRHTRQFEAPKPIEVTSVSQ